MEAHQRKTEKNSLYFQHILDIKQPHTMTGPYENDMQSYCALLKRNTVIILEWHSLHHIKRHCIRLDGHRFRFHSQLRFWPIALLNNFTNPQGIIRKHD